jgi:AcrR family transcriptional regulator
MDLSPLKVKPQQLRSEVTTTNILESTFSIMEVDKVPLERISILEVAKKSGYSVGAVYRYFIDKQDILTRLFGFYIKRIHSSCYKELIQFPNNANVRQLSILMVDHYINDFHGRNIKNCLTLFRLFAKYNPRPETLPASIDVLIAPLSNIMKNDTTGTLRLLNPNQIRVNLRGLAQMIRSPFLEQDPYSYSSEYRNLLIDNCVLLFGKTTISTDN